MMALILLALIVNSVLLHTLWKRTRADIDDIRSDIKKLRKYTGLDKHEMEMHDLGLNKE